MKTDESNYQANIGKLADLIIKTRWEQARMGLYPTFQFAELGLEIGPGQTNERVRYSVYQAAMHAQFSDIDAIYARLS